MLAVIESSLVGLESPLNNRANELKHSIIVHIPGIESSLRELKSSAIH